MKIILLFIFWVVLKSAIAQNPCGMKSQLKNSTALNPFNNLLPENKNYVGLYLRSETNSKIFGGLLNHKATIAKESVKEFPYFSKQKILFDITELYLNKKIEVTSGQLAMNKIAVVLADV